MRLSSLNSTMSDSSLENGCSSREESAIDPTVLGDEGILGCDVL